MRVRIVRMLHQACWELIKRNWNATTRPSMQEGELSSSLRLYHHNPKIILLSFPSFVKTNPNLYISQVNGRVESDLHSCTGTFLCSSLIPADRNHLQINLKEHILSSLGDFRLWRKTYLHAASLRHIPTRFPLKNESDIWLEVNRDWYDKRMRQAGFAHLGKSQSYIHRMRQTYQSNGNGQTKQWGGEAGAGDARQWKDDVNTLYIYIYIYTSIIRFRILWLRTHDADVV